jgi:hypothetical protein
MVLSIDANPDSDPGALQGALAEATIPRPVSGTGHARHTR